MFMRLPRLNYVFALKNQAFYLARSYSLRYTAARFGASQCDHNSLFSFVTRLAGSPEVEIVINPFHKEKKITWQQN